MLFGLFTNARDKQLAQDLAEQTEQGRSLTRLALSRFVRNRIAVLGFFGILFFTLMAIFAPLVTPWTVKDQDCARSNRLTCLSEYQDIPDPPRSERRFDEEKYSHVDREAFTQALIDYRPATEDIPADATFFEQLHIMKAHRDRLQKGELRPFERAAHPLGTAENGRDVYSMTVYGMRMSIAVALVAALVALVIGVSYGAISGLVGGRTDTIMMRIVDILYAYPLTLLAIIAMGYAKVILETNPEWKSISFFGAEFPTRILLVFVVIGFVEWLLMARIVRGQVLVIKNSDYMEAARATGVSMFGQIRRHVFPNVLGIVVVYMTLIIPEVIVAEAFLAFIGLSIQDPQVSLGTLVSEGAPNLQARWWWLATPGAFMVLLLLCFNFVGDGLRDAFDPKDR